MAKLIYSTTTSLDGYVNDEKGNFDFTEPDEDVHTFLNDMIRPIGTYLFGRRMYEVMSVWESPEFRKDQSQVASDFATIWDAADKVVYSTTLDKPVTVRTRVEREFNPDEIRTMKTEATKDIIIGGPHLAGQAIKAGLVDEHHYFVVPVLLGGGTRAMPDDVRLDLELVDEHRFSNGTVHLHYRSTDS
jgi:dihydrofolate reductase